MSHKLIVPTGYAPKLSVLETEIAIKLVKDTFERELAGALHLTRVSAPLFVHPSTGLNDNLNGVERPVEFDILHLPEGVQIVHSLAKWKRLALHRYGFGKGGGLYTDMNAIRRDEELDNLHSVYVDQWDWEKIIQPVERGEDYLRLVVSQIVGALYRTQEKVCARFPALDLFLQEDITFITTQQLEDRYPGLTPYERECEITKQHGTVFLMRIGGNLKSGRPHDGRAPDYDDWELNGDILVWNPLLERVFEISSMGIRVSPESLDRQLTIAGCDERRELPYHKMLLNGELPLTIGGGIGQSRICMLLLQKAHIGEVQCSVWPQEMMEQCESFGIHLL